MTLTTRIIGILTSPRVEWTRIAAEPRDIRATYRHYIAILAAIPAVGVFLGLARFSVGAGISGGLTTYLSGLITPLVAAVIVEQLAPRFRSSGDTAQALKLVAYAGTPIWLAGILYVAAAFSPLVLLAALYSIYLFYLGLTPMMKTPPDTAVPFMVVSALAFLALNIVMNFFIQAVSRPYYGL
jgi:hypothetical protein